MRLEGELSHVGKRNPENKADWEATPEPFDPGVMDPNEKADRIEEFEERSSVEATLEEQLNNVKAALSRIENNSYGICEIDGSPHPIEERRLEANAAATTCIAHIDNR